MSSESSIPPAIELSPALPLLPKLLKHLRDPESHLDDLVEVIRMDPSLVAELLRLCNSAWNSTGSRAGTVMDAVQRLGMRETYRLVANIVGRSTLGSALPEYGIDEMELWENALFCAKFAESKAGQFGVNPDFMFTAGMLHNLGKIVIQQTAPDKLEEIFEYIDEKKVSLAEAENKVMGTSSVEAANSLLQKWRFPDEIRIPIAHQNHPSEAESCKTETAFLHLCIWVGLTLGTNPGKQSLAFTFDPIVAQLFNLDIDSIEELLLEAKNIQNDVQDELNSLLMK